MPDDGSITPDQALVPERFERLALAELHAAAPASARRALGLELREIGGVLVSIAANDPSILLNRALGLGIDRPATPDAIREIREAYESAGVERFFLHVHPSAEPESVTDWLGAEGLEPQRRWMKFSRGAEPANTVQTDLAVREIGAEHAEDFARILANGFDLTEAARPMLAGLIGRPGWRIFMSFAGGEPAGVGTLFMRDGIGWFDMAATDPAFRGRGAQQAVLARRVEIARENGCSRMFTMTGEAVPGDPQHSYHNILRAGFEESYLRGNWAPKRPA